MRSAFLTLCLFAASFVSAQVVTILSPLPSTNIPSAVNISASTPALTGFNHLEIWDNGTKLGNVFSNVANAVYVLPSGAHSTTVNAVTATGQIKATGHVSYTISEFCTTSSTAQCDFDQLAENNPFGFCGNAPHVPLWTGDACVAQGVGSTLPYSFNALSSTTSLNGQSILFTEQNAGYSNVLFAAYSPNPTTELDSHWVLDFYVYLPVVEEHQAVEFDLQYVWGGFWTKFYTECAFNISNGTGFWGVFSGGNGWTFLDGTVGKPYVPCNRSQFSLPWSGGPNTTGWHHIVWTFTRNLSGYATYTSLVFDGTTYILNYTPTTFVNTGNNQGDFSALVQLDGAQSQTTYPTVQSYVNELNITHTP